MPIAGGRPVCQRAVSAGIVKGEKRMVAIMAAPEVRNDQSVNEHPTGPQYVTDAAPGGGWFDEFKRVEKVFAVLGGMLFAAMLVAYLGAGIENNAVLLAGVVALSLALVGMASLFFPLNWILLKGFLAWRRRRALKRAREAYKANYRDQYRRGEQKRGPIYRGAQVAIGSPIPFIRRYKPQQQPSHPADCHCPDDAGEQRSRQEVK